MKSENVLLIIFSCLLSLQVLAEPSVIGLSRVAVRQKPSVLAKPSHFLKYGDAVEVLEEKGRWRRIQASGAAGWIEFSALGNRKSILKEIGKSDAEISKDYQDEVASAAKGFSEEMEALQKQKNPELNYTAVDRMEKFDVSVEQVISFSRKGKLKSRILSGELSGN